MRALFSILFVLALLGSASAQIPELSDTAFVKFSAGNVTWLAPVSALKAYIGASKIIVEESTPLPNRDTIRFIGTGITASDANGTRTEVALDGDLNALAGLSTNGLVVRTGTDAFTTRSLSTVASNSGLVYAWSSADGVAGNPSFNVNIGALPWKHFAEVATTANITLSGNQTIDGVSTTNNMRVLVKNQSTASQNGMYTASSGAWSRASDLDLGSGELDNGAVIYVRRGTANANTLWHLTTAPPITVGTTAQTYEQLGGSVSVSARLSGNGTGGNPLDLAQQGASAGQTLKWSGSAWAPADDLEGVSGSGTAGRVASWNGPSNLTSNADFRHDIANNTVFLDDTLHTTRLIRSNVPDAWKYRLTNRIDAGINVQHTQSDPVAVTTMSVAYGSLNVGNTTTSAVATAAPNIRLYRARMSGSDAVPAQAGDPLGFIGFQCHRGQSASLENMYDLTNGGLIIGATVDSVAADGTVANKVHIYTKNTGGGAAPTHNERLTVDKNGLVGIGTTTPTAQLDVAGTGAIRVPRGTSAQRPFGLSGMIRLNVDADILEWYDGSDWQSINPGTGGEVNVGQNVGDGAGQVYKDKSGVALRFKTIKAGSGVTVTNNADDVTIASPAPQPAASETIEASNFTATMRRINLVDCSGGARTVTPPASPAINDRFAVSDATASANTNNITVAFATASQKLHGTVQNYVLNVAGAYVEFIYVGTTTGWIATK